MAAETVVLKVGMSCQGCVGAVKRVLGKMEGVESFDIDIDQQKVTVVGNVQRDAVFQTVAKTGKKTEFWESEAAPAEPQSKAAEPESKAAEPESKAAEPKSKAAGPESKAAEPELKAAEPESKAAEPESKAAETIAVV